MHHNGNSPTRKLQPFLIFTLSQLPERFGGNQDTNPKTPDQQGAYYELFFSVRYPATNFFMAYNHLDVGASVL